MQDIFHIKNNKFCKREETMIVQNIIDYILEVSHSKCNDKGLFLELIKEENVPFALISDPTRMK